MKRRKYSDATKRMAVIRLEQETVTEVAKSMKISTGQLCNWRDQFTGKTKPRSKVVAPTNGADVKHAIIFLRQARTAITNDIVNNGGSMSNPIYLLSMQALNALEGQAK